MPDPLATKLERLAPTVDLGASRELFERLRDGATVEQPNRSTRMLLAVASVVLVIAGAVGIWAVTARHSDAPAVTPMPTESGDGTEFDVVAVEPVGAPDARSIEVAGTSDELVSIVSRFGPTVASRATDIDFATHVAVVFERPGSSSPDDLARFDPSGNDWVAAWQEPGGDIEDIGIGYVYLVAVERDALVGVDWFVTPAEPRGSEQWAELRAPVPPQEGAAPPSTSIAPATTAAPATEDDVLRDATEVLLDISVATSELGPGAVGVATSPAQYDSLWATFGTGDRPPADLAQVVVLAFTFVDDGCPASFRGLHVDRTTAFPRIVADLVGPGPLDDCVVPPPNRLVVLAIGRNGVLPPAFDFTVPSPFAPDVTTRLTVGAPAVTATAVYVGETSAPIQTLVAVADPQAYETMWSRLGVSDAAPPIDFATQVAVAFVVPDDPCPLEFREFLDAPGDPYPVWTPQLFEAEGACRASLVPRVFVVAVDRWAMDSGVTFRLAADPVYGPEERAVPLALPGLITDVQRECGPTDGAALAVQVASPFGTSVVVEVLNGDDVIGSARLDADTGVDIRGRTVWQTLVSVERPIDTTTDIVVRDANRVLDRVVVGQDVIDSTVSCG